MFVEAIPILSPSYLCQPSWHAVPVNPEMEGRRRAKLSRPWATSPAKAWMGNLWDKLMEILAVFREMLGVHVGEMVGTDFEEFMEVSWDF